MQQYPDYQNITIESIDKAVAAWFDLTVDAHVKQPNGDRKKVVVNWSSGERWVTSRTKRGVRDSNGVLILPIISIRRSNINPEPSMGALGAETANIVFSKRISQKTNDLMNLEKLRPLSQRSLNKPVVYEVFSIPFPDKNKITYELQIQAQYISQMNSILEKMFNELDIGKSFVAEFDNPGKHPQIGVEFEDRKSPGKAYVVGFFDSTINDAGNLEEFTDQERIIAFNTSFTVPAVLQLDPEGEKPAVKMERTAFNLRFVDEEVVFLDDLEEIEKIFGS
jgi:hypothetical protein